MPPIRTGPLGRLSLTRKERQNLRVGLLFISPWIVGFLVFLVYPIFYTLRISFTQYTGFGEPKWIGLDNYRNMLNDDLFWKSLYNTLYYTALAVPIGVVVAMGLALAMNQPLPEVPIYRAILYLPSIIPLFTLSFIFLILMNPTQGIFNQILIRLGLPNVNWFGDPAWTKLAFVFIAQFGAGQVALIFLAGLKGIPRHALRGGHARRRRRLEPVSQHHPADDDAGHPLRPHPGVEPRSAGLHPGLRHHPGRPGRFNRFYVIYLYDNAFRYGKMGYASAMAWILFLITFVLAMLVFRWSRRWVHYETQ